MNLRKYLAFSVLVVLSLLVVQLSFFTSTSAQGSSDINVNYVQSIDQPDQRSLLARVYFTLTDASKKVILKPSIAAATFTIADNGEKVKATVSQATGPISLVVILDTSGSMNPTMTSMQNAAAQLVNSVPADSQVAVIQFSDKVNLIQDFTTNKAQAIDKIKQIKAGGNTCLYNAIYQGVQTLQKATPGRRAIVVFTDGKDETAAGKLCSDKTVDQIIALATDRKSQAPIYSIGLRGSQPIAEAELRSISNATSGTVALGTNVASMFQEIQDAINAQQVAEAPMHPSKGDHNLVFQLTLGDKTESNPATVIINSPNDYSITPTNTPTVTLPPPVITVNTVRQDNATNQLVVDVQVTNDKQVKQYRIDLINAGGLLQKEIVVPAPLPNPLNIPYKDLPGGDYSIHIAAIGVDGTTTLAQSPEVKFKFTATATPTFTITPTPQPISATIQSIAYDDPNKKANIVVNLTLQGRDQIGFLSASISDARTQLTVSTFAKLDVNTQVTLSLQGVPGGEYNVNIITYNVSGQQINSSTQRFVHSLLPTVTPTSTFTVTPLVISAVLGNPLIKNQTLTIPVQTINENLIANYKVQLIDQATNLVVKEYTVAVPPYDHIDIPLADLAAGKYTIQLQGQDATGKFVTQASKTDLVWAPPTATPTLTPTLTPTPEPTGLIPSLTKAVSDPGSRPIVLGGFAMIVVIIVVAIVLLSRRPKKRVADVGVYLSPPTGAIDLSSMAAERDARSADATNQQSIAKQGASSGDQTNPISYTKLPEATLTIEDTLDNHNQNLVGKTVLINHVPFSLGRNNRDLNFNDDMNVSREHAEITYQGGIFSLIDKGSTHHSMVDGQELQPNVPEPLHNGSTIMLGSVTMLTFKLQTGRNEAMDNTFITPTKK